MTDIVDIAWQIIEMDRIIQDQRDEIEHLKGFKNLYFELLDSSVKHNEEMMANTLKMLLNPKVTVALMEDNPFKEKVVV
jgi:hypothetical protein